MEEDSFHLAMIYNNNHSRLEGGLIEFRGMIVMKKDNSN